MTFTRKIIPIEFPEDAEHIAVATALNFGDGSRKLLKLYNLLKFLTSDFTSFLLK